MVYPSLNQVQELMKQGDYRRIPIKMELFSDTITPVMAIQRLKQVSHHCFLLESAEQSRQWGRYTFLGYDPTVEITCQNGEAKIVSDTIITEKTDHPGVLIRKILKENKAPALLEMPPFCGGLVGYFSYDYIKYSEPSLRLDAKDEESF